jgi:hypothetical protein
LPCVAPCTPTHVFSHPGNTLTQSVMGKSIRSKIKRKWRAKKRAEVNGPFEEKLRFESSWRLQQNLKKQAGITPEAEAGAVSTMGLLAGALSGQFVDVKALEAEHEAAKAEERMAAELAPITAPQVETEAAKNAVPLTYGASTHGVRKPRKEEYINKDPYINTDVKRFTFNKQNELPKPQTGAKLEDPAVLAEKVAGVSGASSSVWFVCERCRCRAKPYLGRRFGCCR